MRTQNNITTMNKLNLQKGFVVPVVIAIVAILIGGGVYVAMNKKASVPADIETVATTTVTTTTNNNVGDVPPIKNSNPNMSGGLCPAGQSWNGSGCGNTINLLSPVGGEKLEIGKVSNIRWGNYRGEEALTIALQVTMPDGRVTSKILASNVPAKATSYEWMVGAEDTNGKYKIEVYPAGGRELVGRSINYFSIYSQTAPVPSGSNLKIYKNDQYGFEVKYPSNWTTQAYDSNLGGFYYVAINSPGSDDGYAETPPTGPYILVKVYPNKATLENFVKQFTYLKGEWVNTSVDSTQAKQISLTGQQNQKVVLTAFVRNNFGYEITYPIFDKDPDAGKNVLGTFNFTN